MRTLILLYIVCISAGLRAQGTWVQKASMPPGNERLTAVAFTIGNKGYLGVGLKPGSPIVYLDDFWEYDPVANAWTQKANFGGGVRGYGVGCEINGKGYVGTGMDVAAVIAYNDWWEYDPGSNSWLQKANCPAAVGGAFCFSIGAKGYVGTGGNSSWNCTNGFYEYDPVTDVWTAKAAFAGPVRYDLDRACFVIGTNGYCGLGYCQGSGSYTDFWEYNSLTDIWTQKANYPGSAAFGATGFSICGLGFLGLGTSYSPNFWSYDPASNSWNPVSPFPGGGRVDQPSFVINNRAYVGTGYDGNNKITFRDLWEFSYSGSFLNTTNVTICQGNAATLTASGGNTYSWNNGQTTSSIVVSPSANTTYTVISAGNCGADTGYASVTLASSITASISPNTTICAGQTVTLSASGGTPYSWNTGASASSIVVSPSSTSNYSVIVGSGSCTDTASTTVTVSPFIATAGPNTTICPGQTVTLTASGGNSYLWSNGSSASSAAVSPAITTNYTVTVSNGACSDTAVVAVTVSPPPVASAANATICSGQTATLTASGGGNYSWSNGSSTSSATVSPTSTSTYSVIVSIGNCSDTASATVTVNPSPAVSITGNTTLCVGDIATLTASGGNTYSWNNGSTANTISVNPASSAGYTVIASNANGCTVAATVAVSVSPPPIASAENATICSGQTATLTASGGTNYSWSNGSSTSSATVSPASTSGYSVIVSIGSCSDTASATVTVDPSPTASAFSNVTITEGQSTTLSASGGGTYLWSNGSTQNPITVAPPVTTIYCVAVTQNNCSDTACVTVTVELIDCSYDDDQLFIPDAFSPNADTKNDVLGVYYPNPSCIKTFILIIYDRWGEKVFEADNVTALWDGTYKGKLMNTAVFVYYMKVSFITGNEVIRKGNISLIR